MAEYQHAGASAAGSERRVILCPDSEDDWAAELGRIERAIGYCFKNRELLKRALTHSSCGSVNYEQLEFLGDSILNCAVTAMLCSKFRNLREGRLTNARSRLVNQDTLADIAKQLGLGKALRIGVAKENFSDLTWQSILSDCVESIIAAVKEDSGFAEALALTSGLYKSRIARLDKSSFAKDAKSRLRDLLRRQGLPDPEYCLKSIQGNLLNRLFVVSCSIPSLRLNAVGRGPNKKRSEIDCAEKMLSLIERRRGKRVLYGKRAVAPMDASRPNCWGSKSSREFLASRPMTPNTLVPQASPGTGRENGSAQKRSSVQCGKAKAAFSH